MQLTDIVPWGRSLREYTAMFELSAADRQRRLLGCGDGPASFNAEWTQAGGRVVSCDPIYQFSAQKIRARFEATAEIVIEQVHKNPADYVWTFHRSPTELVETRRTALTRFLADYSDGRSQGRYVVDELPRLKFSDRSFNLALCSHLLFLYSDLLSFEFHLESIVELCRVAGEVRIFPLTDLRCEISKHLQPLIAQLKQMGYSVERQTVAYQLQRDGNQMLMVSAGPG